MHSVQTDFKEDIANKVNGQASKILVTRCEESENALQEVREGKGLYIVLMCRSFTMPSMRAFPTDISISKA